MPLAKQTGELFELVLRCFPSLQECTMFYRPARLVTSVVTVAALAVGSLAATPPARAASKSSQCAQVHVFAARGSAEPPGPGAIQSLVDLIKSHSDRTVSSNAIDYPALLFPYGQSSASGTAAVKQQITDQVEKCPRQKIVLVGYSQGAHIIGDALGGGGGGNLGPETPPLDASIGDHVTAVIQMGDPRYTTGKPYNVGTAQRDGVFPRLPHQALSAFADRTRSYCDDNDPYCASGYSLQVHLGYLDRYSTDALGFVLREIGG
ncbi:cutinase family protein [Streptomyces bobili]|uniref:cutinase family protein n=1 Tax=Streptomyces bobili TaxID=67280 RepID=UPI0036EA3398